jgi:hypothetical protein
MGSFGPTFSPRHVYVYESRMDARKDLLDRPGPCWDARQGGSGQQRPTAWSEFGVHRGGASKA